MCVRYLFQAANLGILRERGKGKFREEWARGKRKARVSSWGAESSVKNCYLCVVEAGYSPQFADYVDNYTLANKLRRLAWRVCRVLLFRPFGLPVFHRWRALLLRLWGARLPLDVHVYASADVWAPWNLRMGHQACLAPHTIVYNPALISLGERATVSQYAYLCTATHDYTSPQFTLYSRPITLCAHSWVAARAFVGPGVTVGEGGVVGANATVFKDVAPWAVVAGNPATVIKERVINDNRPPSQGGSPT